MSASKQAAASVLMREESDTWKKAAAALQTELEAAQAAAEAGGAAARQAAEDAEAGARAAEERLGGEVRARCEAAAEANVLKRKLAAAETEAKALVQRVVRIQFAKRTLAAREHGARVIQRVTILVVAQLKSCMQRLGED